MNIRTEHIRFSREDLEHIIKWHAKARLIGAMYVGFIGDQELRWNTDGSVEVFTKHVPA